METIVASKSLYTYQDYLTWPSDERWELIDGIAYNMTPAPSSNHQRVIRELSTIFNIFLKGKSCEIFPAPFDVRLPKQGEDEQLAKTVVQPDLTLICNKQFVDRNGCTGCPDLVIEVTSPSTMQLDLKVKFRRYEIAGVKEYWIVHPEGRTIVVYILGSDDKYGRPNVYTTNDQLPVNVVPDLIIDLNDIFQVISDD
ncbi:MAG TPA: Uma2 family endonuclease [Desulfosporosinus sp.]|nr:Uma2 family endonuclease [Desulfosporosinus sp.]